MELESPGFFSGLVLTIPALRLKLQNPDEERKILEESDPTSVSTSLVQCFSNNAPDLNEMLALNAEIDPLSNHEVPVQTMLACLQI